MGILKHLPKSILLLSLLVSITMLGQTYPLSSTKKKAIKYYIKGEAAYILREYPGAEASLLKAIKSDKNFIEAWLLIGDLYAETGKAEKALNAYQSAIQIDSGFYPQVYYIVGNLYYEIGDYQAALNSYDKFTEWVSDDTVLISKVEFAKKRAGFAKESKFNPHKIDIENVGTAINTIDDEYINFINSDKNELVLTRKHPIAVDEFNRTIFSEFFYRSQKAEGNWVMPDTLELEWSNNLNLGGMNLSVDGRKMYFTGCGWPSGFGSCDLYVSHRTGDKWEAPFNLGSSVNSQWWDSQPMISSNKKRLYFASKRAGGKGGSDIWMTIRLKNGKWSTPINLGDSINTPGNEMAPFVHADGKTMYFSSDGHIGMGKSDIFISRMDDVGRWSKAQNLGYPINTNHNEVNLYISIDGTETWITSDRPGGEGKFDIYSFETPATIKPQEVAFVKGKTIDKTTNNAIQAIVELTNLKTGDTEDSTLSDPVTGEFLMILQNEINYAFNISKKGYVFYSENFNLVDSVYKEPVEKSFYLSPIKAADRFVLDNVFFDFNESGLKSESFKELNRLLQILKEYPKLKIKIEGHTDSIGENEYNLELSEKRARSVYQYFVENGIDEYRLSFIGFGSTMPTASNSTEQGRAKNRRTEVEFIK